MQLQKDLKLENPYWGLRNCLTMYQRGAKSQSVDVNAAFNELENAEQRRMLLRLITSIGDVPGRTPMGLGKVDNGGNGQREFFRDQIIPATLKHLTEREKDAFAEIVAIYATLDDVVATRVRTSKVNKRNKTSKVVQTINMPQVWGVDRVVRLLTRFVRGTEMQKYLVAKWLIEPRFRANMRPETRKLHETRFEILVKLSENLNWLVARREGKNGSYTSFVGFRNWKREFTRNFESSIFSSGRIKNLDREEFLGFLASLPNDARNRVMLRLQDTEKYPHQLEWFNAWKQHKADAQAEVRKLEEERKTAEALGADTLEIEDKLRKARKNAKVNAGSTNTTKLFLEALYGRVDELQLEAFVDKVDNPFNFLTIIDESGSMNSGFGTPYAPRDFAAFVATLLFRTNPDIEGSQLLGMFSDRNRWFTGIRKSNLKANSLMRGATTKVRKPLFDPEASFRDNFATMKAFLRAESAGRGTNIASVARNIAQQMHNDPTLVEGLTNYPVWIFISDGNKLDVSLS